MERSPASVIAYVSGHGFGHAAREVEILRRVPERIPLVVKSSSPEWFWRAEMGRPFTFVSDSFDVGCVQRDSIGIDVPATLTAWRTMAENNQGRRDTEADDLRERRARLVVTDVASFPLTVAATLGIPSLCVANFTWADIYENFVNQEPAFGPIAADLTTEYAAATLALDTAASLPMPYFPRRENVGLVARPGAERRSVLERHLGKGAQGKRLGLVYLGNWGYPLPYERLESFRDWHWIAMSSPPATVTNWTAVSRDLMSHVDLVASVDLVVSKPGYGIVGECVSQGTPLLYCPRPEFAEYPALDALIQRWGGGLRVPMPEFLGVRWEPYLARVGARGTMPRQPAPGGPRAASLITRFYDEGA